MLVSPPPSGAADRYLGPLAWARMFTISHALMKRGIMLKRTLRPLLFLGILSVLAHAATEPAQDPRLQKGFRFQKGGWTYVHLEGSPAEIGYQHGYLLAPEIQD